MARLRDRWLTDGYVQLPSVLGREEVARFVDQNSGELAAAGETERERSVGAISLRDEATWPTKGQRRVVECAPDGVGDHWAALRGAKALTAALDELLGEGAWVLPVNESRADRPDAPRVRHWYFPVVFPEHRYEEEKGNAAAPPKPPPLRPVLLESVKDERRRNPRPAMSSMAHAWQPVSRRRVRGKGWHIDAGPGFPNEGLRTVRGHAFQGCVVLLLLSDCGAGAGGTVMVPGSHRAVEAKLRACAPGGISHADLNRWAVDEMLAAVRERRVVIPTEPSVPAEVVCGDLRSAAEPLRLRQICGAAGDVVLMHPWLLHSGTTNLAREPRIMGNGMVRFRDADADWERVLAGPSESGPPAKRARAS